MGATRWKAAVWKSEYLQKIFLDEYLWLQESHETKKTSLLILSYKPKELSNII